MCSAMTPGQPAPQPVLPAKQSDRFQVGSQDV